MRIAIHKSSWGFTPYWIAYCQKNNIPFKLVNCYDSDIIQQLEDCNILLWHHHHSSAKDVLFAKGLLFSLEQSGKKVFPEFNANWHFDDKLGQKYLLETVHAPLAKSWVFYDKKEALKWVNETTFPKVFKLRGGAGSSNVKLVKTSKYARKLIRQAFGRGFPAYDKINDLKEQWLRLKVGRLNTLEAIKSIRRLFVSTKFSKTVGRQKGYIYFQEFIPNNSYDIRVVTIEKRAFALKRMVRPNDFRASGSGLIVYEKNEIDERCVKLAFETSKKLKASCVAYDFVFDGLNNPVILEINYGFTPEAYLKCPGWWDDELNWHEGSFNSAEWIVDYIIHT
ncbi:MAG TPA: hypothetical protein PKA54_09740 [Chitinophagaceae bacterium]|nr:hypothetical protein [Chitinophagaceae bacterium]